MRALKPFWIWVNFVFVVFGPAGNWGPGLQACPYPLPSTSGQVKDYTLHLEIAARPDTRTCGLSRRQALAEDNGMLFVFPEPVPLVFWMKDTYLALSIAFLDDHGRILSIENMTPLDMDRRYQSPIPVRYAVEVSQGWFEKKGIQKGDRIEFSLPQVIEIR